MSPKLQRLRAEVASDLGTFTKLPVIISSDSAVHEVDGAGGQVQGGDSGTRPLLALPLAGFRLFSRMSSASLGEHLAIVRRLPRPTLAGCAGIHALGIPHIRDGGARSTCLKLLARLCNLSPRTTTPSSADEVPMTQKAVTPFTGSKDLARRHDRRVPLRVGRAPAGGGISGRVFRLGGTVTW